MEPTNTAATSPVRTRVDMSMTNLMSSPSPSPSPAFAPRTAAAYATIPPYATTTMTTTTTLPSIAAIGQPPPPPLPPQFHVHPLQRQSPDPRPAAATTLPPLTAPFNQHQYQHHQNHQLHHHHHHHYTTTTATTATTAMQSPPPAVFSPPQPAYLPHAPKPVAAVQQLQQQPRQTQSQKQSSPTPNQIPPGGAPARRFLNDHVTPALLDGMKMLAREQPQEPLLALAKFLEERHREMQLQKEHDGGEDIKMGDANGTAGA